MAAARLAGRGLLRPDGSATAAGATLHREIEHATDVAAARPWASLTDAAVRELADLLEPIAARCAAVLPVRSPIGVAAQ
jgi:hypothetical protein